MSASGTSSGSSERRRAMLRTAMGPAIAAALGDPRVVEVMVNPDGALRVDVLGEGRIDTDVRLEPAQVERIIRLVASHIRSEVHSERPIVSAELPSHEGAAGERFEGVLPPVSLAPCFSIRKPAARIYTLLDYVTDGILSADAARLLSLAVVDRSNILVVGGTSSGKTTLANALLAEMAHLNERVGYQGVMTAHGFRSTASSLLNESERWLPDVIESALAHQDQNAIRATYNRASYWKTRVEMMQWWSNHLDTLRATASG